MLFDTTTDPGIYYTKERSVTPLGWLVVAIVLILLAFAGLVLVRRRLDR